MGRIPLEDNVGDVVAKAQRGLGLTDEVLATRAGVGPGELSSLQRGDANPAVLRRVARHLRLGPDALTILANKGWYPAQPVFPTGFAAFNSKFEDMTVNSYLIWDARTRQAAAFDTGTDCSELLSTLEAESLELRYIFLTHSHPDHVAELPRLAGATKAEVWASEKEPSSLSGARVFKENAHFHVGPLAIKTLLTSGHSPGLTTFYVTGLSWPLAVVGDAVFASSMGGSETHFEEQLRNNREKIFTLPRDTVLACGHGPLTTVAQEKLHNPFFSR